MRNHKLDILRLILYLFFSCWSLGRYESIVETAGGEKGSPKIVTYREDARSTYSKPYLILDVRDKASFERGHLLQARSFPCTLLRRDQIPPELYTFRNQPGNLIILYCDDEKDSREAAKTFVDRGKLISAAKK